MKTFQSVKIIIAACITGFQNAFVITDDVVDDMPMHIEVGHDWLSVNAPVIGDYIVQLPGRRYELVRAADAVGWELVEEPPVVTTEPRVDLGLTPDGVTRDETPDPPIVETQWVIGDGESWINENGNNTSKPDKARLFDDRGMAEVTYQELGLPDTFNIVGVAQE